MNSVLNPVGPEDPKTYWQRRALVLGGIVVALVVIFVLIGRAFGGDAATVAESSAAETASQGAEATDEVGAESGASGQDTTAGQGGQAADQGGAGQEQKDKSTPGEVLECADSDIEVTVETDSQSYNAGQSPVITMMITNTSGEPCTRDIGAAANEVKITSGGYDVWSSDDCSSSETKDVVEMPADESASVNISWDRKLSSPGCVDQRADAQPGAYQVTGRNGSVTSEQVGFALAS